MTEPGVPCILQESSEALYENAPCGLVSTLSDGLIVRANRTLLTWLDMAADELVGKKRFYELFTAGGRIYYETHYSPLLRMQGHVREIALELRCRSGQKLPVVVTAVMSQSAGSDAPCIRIAIFDSTDRRKYEQELLWAQARAQEATQAKAALIATVSHEIRGPLGAIIAVRHLLERSELSAKQQKIVAMLHASSEGLLTLVNDILDMSKLDAGRTTLLETTIDVRDLLTDVLASVRARALEKALTLECKVDEGLPRALLGDAVRIRQILLNLVTNAIKFTDQGWVCVTVGCVRPDASSAVVTFEVSDSGVGIEPEKLAEIFEPYTQAHPGHPTRYGGTGLGLAISKQLVELHGGELTVRSTPGKGSTFAFTIALRTE